MKKCIAMMLVALFLVTGCAGMTDQSRTRAEGAGAGAAIGAAIGALIGQIIGKDSKSTIIGTGVGTAIGSGVGLLYGNFIADQKAQFASDEDFLNACIASAQQETKKADNLNESLRAAISDHKKKINRLVRQYNRKQITKAQMSQEKQYLERWIAQQENNRQEIDHKIAIFQEAIRQGNNANGQAIAALDNEIHKLEKAADELEQQTQALASINQSIKL